MGLLGSIKKGLFGGKTKKAQTKTEATQNVTENPYAPTIDPINRYVSDTEQLYRDTPLFSTEEQQANSNFLNASNAAAAAPLFSPEEMASNARYKEMVDRLYNAPMFSPEELEANARFIEGNRSAIGDVQLATDENNKTLRGEYLSPDSNPYLADIAKRVSGMAGAQASATFGGKGRSGGGLAGYYSGKATSDSLTDLYGKNYEAERGRMGNAVGYAPTLATTKSGLYGNEVELGQGITNRPFDRAEQLKDPMAQELAISQGITNRPVDRATALSSGLGDAVSLTQGITNRGLERNAAYGGILSGIAGLGGTKTGVSTGKEDVYGKSSGLLGSIFNAAANKVFGTSFRTN